MNKYIIGVTGCTENKQVFVPINNEFKDHINDKIIHITQAERDKWNSTLEQIQMLSHMIFQPRTKLSEFTNDCAFLSNLQINDLINSKITSVNQTVGVLLAAQHSMQLQLDNLNNHTHPNYLTQHQSIKKISDGVNEYELTGEGTVVIQPHINPQNFELEYATDKKIGGIRIGYVPNGQNFPVQLDNGRAYVNVPIEEFWGRFDIPGLTYAGEFKIGKKYKSIYPQDYVKYNGTYYLCIENIDEAQDAPDSNNSQWTQMSLSTQDVTTIAKQVLSNKLGNFDIGTDNNIINSNDHAEIAIWKSQTAGNPSIAGVKLSCSDDVTAQIKNIAGTALDIEGNVALNAKGTVYVTQGSLYANQLCRCVAVIPNEVSANWTYDMNSSSGYTWSNGAIVGPANYVVNNAQVDIQLILPSHISDGMTIEICNLHTNKIKILTSDAHVKTMAIGGGSVDISNQGEYKLIYIQALNTWIFSCQNII